MSTQSAASRYPKRQRKAVAYQEPQEFDQDMIIPAANDNENESEAEDEDETYRPRAIKRRKKVKKRKTKPIVKRVPKWMPFRLMDLPPELRLKIYEEALVDPHGVYIRTYDDKGYEKVAVHVSPRFTHRSNLCYRGYAKGVWGDQNLVGLPWNTYRLSPNLLATCKTVYDEAFTLLWKQPFIFADVYGLFSFLTPLRPTTISLLEDITILKYGWLYGRTFPAFVLLRDALNIQNLRFDCEIRKNSEVRNRGISPAELGEKLADRLYKDTSPFLKPLVAHRGVDALLKIVKFSKDDLRHCKHIGDVTAEHEKEVMEAMTKQITKLLDRKIAPKFTRY